MLPSPPSVCVASASLPSPWVPRYGAWSSEWSHLTAAYHLGEGAVERRWSDTACFLSDAADDPAPARALGRGYVRVSPPGLKAALLAGLAACGGTTLLASDAAHAALSPNLYSPPLSTTATTTTLGLEDGTQVKARIVFDGTGAESRLTVRPRGNEGYQIAYGLDATVSGPGVTASSIGGYDKGKMTLFDFRASPLLQRHPTAVRSPTFNYVMPLGGSRAFFEETSLVASPALSFAECKARLLTRLSSLGVSVDEVHEEELCYIPMGGGLPPPQRVVPVGAAAGLVHPATGYQLCRAMEANLAVAAKAGELLAGGGGADEIAEELARRMWTPEAVAQRNFAVFGGDFLMKQNVYGLQGFFKAFFEIDKAKWSGFLAGYGDLPDNAEHSSWSKRLAFGLAFLVKLPPKVALDLVASIFTYTAREGPDLIQSVTPLFGLPDH
ncbi:hypothetical protein TeGR_g4772 [Tetraparma gracilis]|uniref:Lycopene beta-cyclase n=1 Tax=Tetraparma gracilis TaxID=2962635 RepID=A0ABQ6NCP1_9STRA|nr:hypothetical protein TeGR_g4772 [Tetraparma gracilis]